MEGEEEGLFSAMSISRSFNNKGSSKTRVKLGPEQEDSSNDLSLIFGSPQASSIISPLPQKIALPSEKEKLLVSPVSDQSEVDKRLDVGIRDKQGKREEEAGRGNDGFGSHLGTDSELERDELKDIVLKFHRNRHSLLADDDNEFNFTSFSNTAHTTHPIRGHTPIQPGTLLYCFTLLTYSYLYICLMAFTKVLIDVTFV